MLRSLIVLCFFFLIQDELFAQKNERKLFEDQIRKNSHDTTLCIAYDQWANSIYVRNLDSAAILWELERAIAEKNYNKLKSSKKKSDILLKKAFAHHLSNSIGGLAYYHQLNGRLEKGLELNFQSLEIAKQLKDSSSVATLTNNIGQIYETMGDFGSALDYYDEAEKIKLKLNNPVSLAYTIMNKGMLLYRLGKPDEAMKQFKQSLAIRLKTDDKRGLASSYSGIATLLRDQGKLEEAKVNFEKTLELQTEIQDLYGKCITLNHLGVLQDKFGNMDKANEYYIESYNLASSFHYLASMVYSVDNLGWNYFRKKDYVNALEYGKKSFEMAKELGNPENIKYASELLYNVYKNTGRANEALTMHETFVKMRDSLNTQTLERTLRESKMKNDYEMKNQKLASLRQKEKLIRENEKRVEAERASYQFLLNVVLFIGLGFMIIVSLIIWKRFKVSRLQNRIINEQRIEVIRQKAIIEAKQKEVLDSIHYARRIQNALLPSDKLIDRSIQSSKGNQV